MTAESNYILAAVHEEYSKSQLKSKDWDVEIKFYFLFLPNDMNCAVSSYSESHPSSYHSMVSWQRQRIKMYNLSSC